MVSVKHDGDRTPLLNGTNIRHEDKIDITDISECQDNEPLQDSVAQTEVYTRRWYVLALFSLLGAAQNILWNTWGPVSDSATLVFGWSGAEIGLFATIGNISYSLTVFAASYIMDVFGLRIATLSMAAMLAVGAGIRCITSHQVVLFWMSVISAILSGVAGTVTLSGPALFSAVWFPPSQRTTATAIVNTFSAIGVSVSFLVGPALVHYVNPNMNNTEVSFSTPNTTQFVIEKQRDEIMLNLYVDAAIAGFLFLLVLVYFPSKPPLPPSLSASTSRLDFKKGFFKLARNRSFWCLALAYAIPAGMIGVWGSVLNINLQPVHVSQATAGQIGLYLNLGGGLAGLVVSRCSDLFSCHMKQILIALTVLAAGSLWWMVMLMEQYIPFNLPSLYVSAILASIFINGGMVLYYELSSEMCYPVAEGVIGGYITLFSNMSGIIFLSLLYVPNIGTRFMNWTMFGGTLFALPLLFLVKARYRRLRVDCGEIDPSIQAEQHVST